MAEKGFFDKLRRGVEELVTESSGRDAAPEAQASGGVAERGEPAAHAPVGRTDDKAQFDAQLRSALDSAAEVSGGGLHLVGLAQLKERFGDQWPKLQDKAITLACRVIDRHLTPGAFYKQVGEDQFMVAFPDLDEMQARLKTGLIAEKINDLLLGEQGERLVDTKSGAVSMDGSFVEQDEQDSLLAMGVGDKAQRCEESPVADSSGPLPDWLGVAPEPGELPKISEMGFIFRPMWRAAKGQVSTYLCKPAVALANYNMAVGDQVFDFWDAESHGWKVDIATLKAAAKAAQDAAVAGRATGLAAPVHWDTLTNDTKRVRYLTAAWQIPPAARKRLILEVVGVPETVTDEKLRAVVQSLQPVCLVVILGVPPSWRSMGVARQAGVKLIGFDARNTRYNESDLLRVLERFAQAARRQRMGCYVHGLGKTTTTLAALAAGYNFLDGDVVAPRARSAGEPFRLDVETLYKRRMGRRAASPTG